MQSEAVHNLPLSTSFLTQANEDAHFMAQKLHKNVLSVSQISNRYDDTDVVTRSDRAGDGNCVGVVIIC